MTMADRDGFTALMRRLTDGLGVAHSEERVDAYFRAFSKIGNVGFERLVDHVLSEDYATKSDGKRRREGIPTVRDLWRIHREFRSRSMPRPPLGRSADEAGHLEFFANRLLWMHIRHRGGLGSVHGHASAELDDCLEAKDELVHEFSGYIREGDELATPAEFIRRWTIELKRRSRIEPATLEAYADLAEPALAQVPFPPYMGRELEPKQRSLVSA